MRGPERVRCGDALVSALRRLVAGPSVVAVLTLGVAVPLLLLNTGDFRRPDGGGWITLADPEGNEFCVLATSPAGSGPTT
jgi:hypothetical protein